MRAVCQRVRRARVEVAGATVGSIGAGWAVLLGAGHHDTPAVTRQMAEKIAHLRCFEDADGRMNRSALDVGAELLVVSQFTLYADTSRGRRPSFVDAAPPDVAEPLVRQFVAELEALGLRVATGVFGAEMLVSLENDGPVTIVLDSADRRAR